MSSRGSGVYLAFFGFVVFLIGLLLCWLATGATQNSFSAVSSGGVELLVGGFVALVGGVFLLIGLMSATRRRTRYYY